MKTFLISAFVVTSALFCGCASTQPGLTLETVGPPSPRAGAAGQDGWLEVFSAFRGAPQMDNASPYHHGHTDYRLLSDNGQLLQTVRNDSSTLFGGPTRVKLAPGHYRVLARANGHGWVTVPVVIAGNSVTSVYLDSSLPSSGDTMPAGANPVRLPDGQIVGWRASK
jgi:hypothetical protein